MRSKKVYEDDDGRTIADMSNISRQPLLIPRFNKLDKKKSENPENTDEEKPWEDNSFSKKERRSFIFGSLGAAFVVGLVFLIGFLAVILLLTLAK